MHPSTFQAGWVPPPALRHLAQPDGAAAPERGTEPRAAAPYAYFFSSLPEDFFADLRRAGPEGPPVLPAHFAPVEVRHSSFQRVGAVIRQFERRKLRACDTGDAAFHAACGQDFSPEELAVVLTRMALATQPARGTAGTPIKAILLQVIGPLPEGSTIRYEYLVAHLGGFTTNQVRYALKKLVNGSYLARQRQAVYRRTGKPVQPGAGGWRAKPPPAAAKPSPPH